MREWLKGKKTYFVAAIGVLGAVVAYADGQIEVVGLIGAIFVAVQSVLIRLGVNTAAKNAVNGSGK